MNLKFNSANSKRLLTHFTLLGINPSAAQQMLATIHTWQEKNGEEWTVSRLKDLKTWFVQHHAGNVSYVPVWFKHTKSGVPKGPFGHLFTFGLKPKRVVKSLSALMAYTAYRSPKVTSKQVKKTIGAIFSMDMLSPESQQELRVKGIADAKFFFQGREPKLNYRFFPAGLNTGKPGEWSDEMYISSFISGLAVPNVARYLENNFECPSALGLDPSGSDEEMMSPGTISLIQERGYKARVIAMPKASIQVAMYPLHQALDRLLKDLPTDCTHNQVEGAQFAQAALAAGKTVYSVDLSGATDNFPRSYQIGILEGLGLHQEANLLEFLASAAWKLSPELSESVGYKYITYTKGQPQGLYGSFPLFGLAHNLLVSQMCLDLGLRPNDNFRILGDDIVITDGNLYNAYIGWLQTFKVPISWDKTLTSGSVAEFAGFVIEAKNFWKPAKVPNASLDNNFISYLKVVGLGGLSQLPSRLRGIARKVAQLPESDGGLGFNPSGTPVWIRRLDLIKVERDSKIPKYLSMQPRLQAALFRGEFLQSRYMVEWLNDQFSEFETRVNETLKRDFPTLTAMGTFTNVFEFLYQLSFLAEGEPDSRMIGTALTGNTSEDVQGVFLSELEIWRSRFHSEKRERTTSNSRPQKARRKTNRTM